jgi:hypothetical protein
MEYINRPQVIMPVREQITRVAAVEDLDTTPITLTDPAAGAAPE